MSSTNDECLWRPSDERVEHSAMRAFAREAASQARFDADDPTALHRWSIEDPAGFWKQIWSFCEVLGEGPGETVIEGDGTMLGTRFFPEARLNFAENLLRRSDDAPALIAHDESATRRELSFAELRSAVASLSRALGELGVEPGDRVAAVLPNAPEAIIAMLATTSRGAIWSSCSPDFGTRGVVDRFGQIEPKILIGVSSYVYGGKRFETGSRLPEIVDALPSVEHLIVSGACQELPKPAGRDARRVGRHDFEALLRDRPDEPLEFPRFAFRHPIAILYSSGTTGKPKCIVHGAGGTLLQHLKEHRLHVGLDADDRFFYFTTCGWMMWNWLVSGLASGSCLVLYDGSPFHPDGSRLFQLAEQERVDVFGVSAKFIDAVAKAGLEPGSTCDLRSVRTILSTGSPLVPESFDFVYRAIKGDVHLASISGGTDIISCFVGGDPTRPVWRGEIQGPGLGMAVEVWDDSGLRTNAEGELVCTRAFPSMPIGFWNDPDMARYRAAYFERFPGVWCHGDWIRETQHGGYAISGRSDAVLNPGGVRIGTAEIYRQVENLEEVLEAIAVGQDWDGDVRVVLFVRIQEGRSLDDALRSRIKQVLRRNASPRHVPAVILEVPDIPRTRSGKITELAVREVIHGRPVKNVEALANPESLEHFRDRVELSAD